MRHVPQVARPLLASALYLEFSLSVRHGLWGFARVLLVPRLVLRSLPRAGCRTPKQKAQASLSDSETKKWRDNTH